MNRLLLIHVMLTLALTLLTEYLIWIIENKDLVLFVALVCYAGFVHVFHQMHKQACGVEWKLKENLFPGHPQSHTTIRVKDVVLMLLACVLGFSLGLLLFVLEVDMVHLPHGQWLPYSQ